MPSLTATGKPAKVLQPTGHCPLDDRGTDLTLREQECSGTEKAKCSIETEEHNANTGTTGLQKQKPKETTCQQATLGPTEPAGRRPSYPRLQARASNHLLQSLVHHLLHGHTAMSTQDTLLTATAKS